MEMREKFNISGPKVNDLILRIKRLGINPADIEETVSKGGGRGGQKTNKTSNRIRLKHLPTGITVVCRRERERSRNRFLALRELVYRYEMRFKPEESIRLKDIEKARRRKNVRRRKARKKYLKENLGDDE